MKTEAEVVRILKSQISNAISGYNSTLESDQSDALDYYHGKKYGNEQEGRSQIVTREVLETVEWMMPSLLRVFTSNRYVQFDPVGPEDEEQCEQETDYVNHVITKDNNAFLIFHDWFKDALLLKNAYVKIWREKVSKVETETYTDLTDEQMGLLLNEDNVEPIEHDERQVILGMDDQGPVIATLHDVKIRRTVQKGIDRVMAVPNEEILVGNDARSVCLDDANFVAHRQEKTVSSLLEMGFDPDIIKSIPRGEDYNNGELENSRFTYSNERDDDDEIDESMRLVTVYECYIRMDYDGDGIAELRKIVMAGNKILENEEAPFIPIEALSSLPMPHKHIGLSQADIVMDLQLIKSTLWRQILDNLYLTNNPEKEVVDGQVNIADLLESVPGGIKRVKAPGSIREIVVPFTAGASIPVLEMLDGMKEGRTGVSRHTMGLDADTLAQATKGAFMGALEQANQRIETVARVFAETGVKGLFRKLHAQIIMHQDKPRVVKMRGKYVTVNPSEWRERTDMTVMVGLGTGNKGELVQKLMMIAEKQEQHLLNGSPMVSLKNLYNTYARIIDASDLKDVEPFFTNPDQIQQQPKEAPPDPNMMALQMQKEIEQGKLQLQLETKQAELRQDEQEMLMSHQKEAAKLRQDAQLEAMKIAAKERENQANIEFEREKAAAQIEVQRAIEMAKLNLEAMRSNEAEGLETEPDQMGAIIEQLALQTQAIVASLNRPKDVIRDQMGRVARVE